MKNRLIVLALAMLCYGHIQAEGWFANQWNKIRNYSPYSATSLRRLSPEDAARRVHAMQLLYGPQGPKELVGVKYQGYDLGKLSSDQDQAVIVTYPEGFSDELSMSALRGFSSSATAEALRNQATTCTKQRTPWCLEVAENLNLLADSYDQQDQVEAAKRENIYKMKKEFLKQLSQEAQASSAPNWLQRQRRIQHHPDYFEY